MMPERRAKLVAVLDAITAIAAKSTRGIVTRDELVAALAPTGLTPQQVIEFADYHIRMGNCYAKGGPGTYAILPTTNVLARVGELPTTEYRDERRSAEDDAGWPSSASPQDPCPRPDAEVRDLATTLAEALEACEYQQLHDKGWDRAKTMTATALVEWRRFVEAERKAKD